MFPIALASNVYGRSTVRSKDIYSLTIYCAISKVYSCVTNRILTKYKYLATCYIVARDTYGRCAVVLSDIYTFASYSIKCSIG